MRANYVILILLMGLATYLTRVGFLAFSKKVKLPNVVYRSLKYIPVAILATLIFPGVFIPNGKLDIALANPYLGASVVTAGTVLISKNSIISIVLGIISLVVLRILFNL
jgi:branched-subunit amino acid transport protein